MMALGFEAILVDWSARRRLWREQAGQVRPHRSAGFRDEEAHRPPRRTRPPGTEINGGQDYLFQLTLTSHSRLKILHQRHSYV